MVLRKGDSCMSVMMLTIFGTTYTHSSAFSDTPAIDIRVLHAKGHALTHFLHDLP